MPRGLNDVPPEKFRFPLDDIKRMQAKITHFLLEEVQIEIDFQSQTQFSCIQKLGGKINAEQKTCNYDEVLALTVEFLKVLDDTMDRPHQVWCMQRQGYITTLGRKQ